jgi:uncharacterized protein (DUF58 family)
LQKATELLKATRRLEIRTRKLVDSIISGQYKTAFRGQGMTFSDFREYVAGDDIRHISWPLMARTGKPYIKKFDEERELQVILALDVSGSTSFGSGDFSKRDKLVHVAATLALSAVKNGDEVGGVLFTDFMEHYVPPKKGQASLQRLLRDLAFFEPRHQTTQLEPTLVFLRGVLKKKSVIFLLSDFIGDWDSRRLRELGKKHDVIACVMEDEFENQVPNLGLLDLWDPETGDLQVVDTGSKSYRELYKKNRAKDLKMRDDKLKNSQVEILRLSNQKDFYQPIVKFFENRRRRR